MATINSSPEIEFDHGSVICPYCGERYGDCWEWVKEHPEEMICEECGGTFKHYAEYTATYYAEPVSPPPTVVVEDNSVADIIVADEIVDVVDDVVDDVLSGVGTIFEAVGEGFSSIVESITDSLDL